MATAMCISDDGNKATFIGTFLETGDNVRLCDECMPNFCAAVFERMTGVDMTPALYLASTEGQANPDGPAGQPGEVAYPPNMEPAGLTGSSAPAPAPADADMNAEQDPTSGGSKTGGGPGPASLNRSVQPGEQDESPPDVGPEEPAAGE